MSKHWRYQILVKTPGSKLRITEVVHDSLRATNNWISEHERYDGQYKYQRFTGSIPTVVLTDVPEPAEPKSDPLTPPVTLLIKLGSIAVHAEEFMSSGGHEFDAVAIQGLLDDPEYREWVEEMNKMAFLPVKRG
jgi:hypothetical protein